MMTAVEKARQLVDKMGGFTLDDAKSNACTTCDIVIEVVKKFKFGHPIWCEKEILHWNEVKSEIRKLHL